MNDKWICIKKYDVINKRRIDYTFNVGDNAYIKDYLGGGIFIGSYSKNDTIPMWIVNEHVYKHFITLAQWREKQINEILE